MNLQINNTSTARTGSTYIIVVGASMLLTLLMLAGLMAIRIQRLEIRNSTDIQAARLSIESGIKIGLFHIRENPKSWRQSANSTTIGNDGINVQFIDPVDGDLTDSDSDPVVVNVTGRSGTAIQHARVRLNSRRRGYDSLLSTIHAGDDISLQNTTVNSSGSEVTADSPWISYGNSLVLKQADVHANVAGQQSPSLTNSTIHGSISSQGPWPRGRPKLSDRDVFGFYQSRGVTIELKDLLQSDHDLNRLQNPLLEKAEDWERVDCSFKEQPGALIIFGRKNDLAGAAQDVSTIVQNKGSYVLGCAVFNPQKDAIVANVRLKIESSNEGVQYFSTPATLIGGEKRNNVSGSVKPTWTGNLLSASWIVTAQDIVDKNASPDFQFNQPVLYDRTYPDGAYVMRNSLLTPKTNPFGDGKVDDEGIYVLDCFNEQVIIENNRVLGTLVLLQTRNVVVGKSMVMQNYIYNYPTLLADLDLTLSILAEPLNESATGTNFNPLQLGTLSQGGVFAVTDEDLDDSYPSRITGMIYVEQNLKVTEQLTVEGVVLVNEQLNVESATLNLDHNSVYYEDPPPGFGASVEMVLMPGNVKRFVSASNDPG